MALMSSVFYTGLPFRLRVPQSLVGFSDCQHTQENVRCHVSEHTLKSRKTDVYRKAIRVVASHAMFVRSWPAESLS